MDGIDLHSPADETMKRMRKGTRCCTECRRRKIKCVFDPVSPVCSRCFKHGLRCIQQGTSKVELSHRGQPIVSRTRHSTPRHEQASRVSRLVAPESRSSPAILVDTSWATDVGTPKSGTADHRAPLPSTLQDLSDTSPAPQASGSSSYAGNQNCADGRTPQAPTPQSIHVAKSSNQFTSTINKFQGPDTSEKAGLAGHTEQKNRSICKALREAMPSFDEVLTTLYENGSWWDSFRQKTHAITQAPIEGLPAFAARAYTSNNPPVLGTLATAYARSVQKTHNIYAMVDSLVVSDFHYTATHEGLECLILLAKAYTDIGQPRRAWLTWRKGMAFAQLMGLYCDASPPKQMIWWAIYHGDRFTSLLLGLPHGFNDLYYHDTVVDASPSEPPSAEHKFILKCALLAGKVIDRNFTKSKTSFAKTVQLEEEMVSLMASMPDHWWNVPEELTRHEIDVDSLRDRLLQQFYFFHVRTYLFLPFLKQSSSATVRDFAAAACMEPCRQALRRFLLLRSKTDSGASLFDCKTSDFVAFTCCVILLHSLSASVSSKQDARCVRQDLNLVSSVDQIFLRLEREAGCAVAAQCHGALTKIREPQSHDSTEFDNSLKISIPFFGVVAMTPRSMTTSPGLISSTHQAVNNDNPISLSTPMTTSVWQESITVHESSPMNMQPLESQQYSMFDFEVGIVDELSGGFGSFDSLTNLNSWCNADAAMMDLNQDWASFTSSVPV